MGVRNENNTRPQNRSTQINEVGNRSHLAMAAPSGEPETEKRKERKEGGASTEIPTWLEDGGRRTADELDRLGCVRPFRSFPSRDPRETDPNPTKAGPNAASTGTRHAGDWRLHLTTHSQSPSLSDLKLLSLAQISRASRMSLRINPSDLSLRVCPPWLSNALSIGQGGRSMEVVRPPLLNAPIGLDAAEPASPQPRRPPRH